MEYNEKLDISDVVKCAKNFDGTLQHALNIEKNTSKESLSEDYDCLFEYQFTRSAVIQVFETTVEKAWKIMQRWIKNKCR